MFIGHSKWRLKKNSFVRKYDDIGLIYNQETRQQLVFDRNGMFFLSQLTRTNRTINDIVGSLLTKYNGADPNQLRSDVHEFCVQLYKKGFLETADYDDKDLVAHKVSGDTQLSANDCALVEASGFLKAHFEKKT